MGFTEQIASFISDVDYSDIPTETLRSVKATVLDYFACTLAGSAAPGVDAVMRVAHEQGGEGPSTVLVLGGKVSPMWASMVNSTMGHAFDFDDTYDAAVLHTSTIVVPAALALAESIGASGRDFLCAVAIGMEVHCRLGLAATLQPAELGWIYTPLMGTFGSAAASARLLNQNKEKTLDTLGFAYSLASGDHQALNEGTLAKRVQPAFSASNGILSALMSRAGLTGPHQAFEGSDGFFKVYLRGNVDPTRALSGLGHEFKVAGLSLKPYPCCRHTHTSIDSMVNAYRTGIRAEEVEQVLLRVNRAAFHAVCEPADLKYSPKTIVDAQFSLPYTAACALLQGWVYLSDFSSEAIRRPEVLALASKVKFSVDESLGDDEKRNITPVKATIKLLGGKEKRFDVQVPKGSPANPMSLEETKLKFSDCVRQSNRAFDADLFGRLSAQVSNLEKLTNVGDLTGMLATSVKGAPRAR